MGECTIPQACSMGEHSRMFSEIGMLRRDCIATALEPFESYDEIMTIPMGDVVSNPAQKLASTFS